MFSGFTQETSDFLWELSFNNERPWFVAHKEQFERCLDRPFKLLANETAELMCQRLPQLDLRLHTTRIYRDARRLFGRGPYKESLWFSLTGATTPCAGLGFWFEVGKAEYNFGMGSFCSTATQMEALRRSIDANPARFERLAGGVAALPEFRCYGEPYKRPKADRGELINQWYNRKNVGVECVRSFGGELFTAELPQLLADEFVSLSPMYEFLCEAFCAAAQGKDEGKP